MAEGYTLWASVSDKPALFPLLVLRAPFFANSLTLLLQTKVKGPGENAQQTLPDILGSRKFSLRTGYCCLQSEQSVTLPKENTNAQCRVSQCLCGRFTQRSPRLFLKVQTFQFL